MKKISLIFITLIIVTVSSCKKKIASNQEVKTKEDLTSSTVKKEKQVDKTKLITETEEVNYDNLTTNEIVVERLLQIKKAIKQENKEKLLLFFDFPVKLEDPLMLFLPYDKLLKRWPSSHTITKKYFLELAEIDKEDGLGNLLTTLDLSVLKKTDSVEKDVEKKDDFCYYMYSIHIDDDKVTLMYGTNTSKYSKSEEDWCPESNHFIIFKIVGNRLVFDKIDMAG